MALVKIIGNNLISFRDTIIYAIADRPVNMIDEILVHGKNDLAEVKI